MADSAPDPSDLLPMVGDIIEHNVAEHNNGRAGTHNTSDSGGGGVNVPPPALLPIQAVVGQAFPLVHTKRSYGRASAVKPSPTRGAAPPAFSGLSAHVQPQDGAARGGEVEGGAGAFAGQRTAGVMQAAGGSAQQQLPAHQWSAAEFDQLRGGYYVAAVTAKEEKATVSTTATTTTTTTTGEDFFNLLFQCLRSTVRKHQQLALEVLLTHLRGLALKGGVGVDDDEHTAALQTQRAEEAVAVRTRCLNGPNCGPFLFFLLEVLVSAGHPAMVELAMTCLLLLLRGLPRGGTAAAGDVGVDVQLEGCESVALMTDAMGELGNPAADAPGGEEDEEEEEEEEVRGEAAETPTTATKKPTAEQDDAELPFSEVSELLRGPDARYGLEQLGFTNKVLATMNLLLYTTTNAHEPETADGAEAMRLPSRHGEVLFLEVLLCGGVGIGHRSSCVRVADDPHFLSWMERQLSAVVLGHRPLADVMELMCVVHHLAHVPAALRRLMRGGCGGERQAVSGAKDNTLTASSAPSRQQQQQRFHESWLLFFLFLCTTTVKEVQTVRQAFTITWALLLLRTCARHTSRGGGGPAFGLVHDLSDTLLAEGTLVGGALVLEMWFLQYTAAADGGTRLQQHQQQQQQQPGSLDAYFLDAARTSLQLCRRSTAEEGGVAQAMGSAAYTSTSSEQVAVAQEKDGESVSVSEAAAAQSFLRRLQWTASAHFVTTYIAHMRQRAPAVCYTLCGNAVETLEAMRWVTRHVVMDPSRLPRAFQRLTTPLLSPSFAVTAGAGADSYSATTTSSPSPRQQGWAPAVDAVLRRWLGAPAPLPSLFLPPAFTQHNIAVLHLAMEAAVLYANTRLAASLADVYPAVSRDVVCGYAALLVHAYEAACLRLRDAAPLRLQVDELSTMTEALQLLQRCGGDGGGDGGTDGGAVVVRGRYDREARCGAFFLLHSIAIAKHCLDVVPLILPLLHLRVATASLPPLPLGAAARDTAAVAPAGLALLASLQTGIELAPVPVMLSSSTTSPRGSSGVSAVAVTGAPRSWVLHPLYDTSFAAKDVWAEWLRGLLGLHRRVKDVVGWDGVLCHTLLWVLTHRRTLWAADVAGGHKATAQKVIVGDAEAEEEERRATPASAPALCALLFDLCAVLHDQCDVSAGGVGQTSLSSAAARTLEIALSAYSDVPSEDRLPLLPHAVLAYVAAHGSPKAALAALQVLLATPVLPLPDVVMSSTQHMEDEGDASELSITHEEWAVVSAAFSQRQATAQVCAWLQTWSVLQGEQRGPLSASSVYWSLDDFVLLLQLVGPHFNSMEDSNDGDGGDWEPEQQQQKSGVSITPSAKPWEGDGLWCVRCLTNGFMRHYLHQRRGSSSSSGALSAMEKAVLSSTLEELGWYPSVLWSLVSE